jgi:GntR family transcriptional regulator / MocR family aminotransferase
VPAPPTDRVRLDFRPSQPDLSSFPRDLWLTATCRVLRSAGNDAFGYGDPRGCPELRRALADHLGRARGVLTSPDLIVVCSGYVQSLALLCQALRARGAATIAHEDPCLPDYPAIMAGTGLQPSSVAVDAGGLQVERLADLRADAVVVTPVHQFPLGPTLAAARRADLLRWARDAAAAAVRSLAVEGLGGYWHSAVPHPAGLVIGYANPPEHAFTGALDALTATLAELYQGSDRAAEQDER